MARWYWNRRGFHDQCAENCISIEVGIFLLSIIISGAIYGNWLPIGTIYSFLTMILIIAFFHLGVFYYMAKMGIQISRRNSFGEKYTRILLPSFLFIPIADIYFIVVSLLKGGIFRDGLKRNRVQVPVCRYNLFRLIGVKRTYSKQQNRIKL